MSHLLRSFALHLAYPDDLQLDCIRMDLMNMTMISLLPMG